MLEHKEADDAAAAHVEVGVRIKPVTVGMSIAQHISPVLKTPHD